MHRGQQISTAYSLKLLLLTRFIELINTCTCFRGDGGGFGDGGSSISSICFGSILRVMIQTYKSLLVNLEAVFSGMVPNLWKGTYS